MSLDLKPEKVKPYLRLLTEAIVTLSGNKGSFRKDIWDYLNKKYSKGIDYRDFLLAIRKFFMEGKLINNEGMYQMHQEVIDEVREKTPTPVFKKNTDSKVSDTQNYYNVLNGAQDSQKGKSKIYSTGKKQKVKPVISQTKPKQDIIKNYFFKKQAKQFGYQEFSEMREAQDKKLGFATPAFDHVFASTTDEAKATPPAQKEQATKRLGIQSKQRSTENQNKLRRKLLNQQINQQSKRITKQKKIQVYLNNINIKKQNKSSLTFKLQQPRIKEEKKQENTPRVKPIPEKEEPIIAFPKKVIEVNKEDLKEKKEKFQNKNNQKLTGKVIKELKKAIQQKNLVMRQAQKQIPKIKKSKSDNLDQKSPIKETKTKVSAKSKAIKKKIKKNRALNQLKSNLVSNNKVYQRRLRGKTLDLQQLGVIKKKKEVNEVKSPKQPEDEKPQKKKELKLKKTPIKAKIEKIIQKKVKNQVKPKIQRLKIEKSEQKDISKEPLKYKKQTKLQKKTKSLKKDKVVNQRIPEKKANIKNQKSFQALDFDRQAKLDAVKALKQLFSKEKDNLYIDGKLIYV